MNAVTTLANQEVHLWISYERSPDEPALRELRTLLQPAELERVDKAYSEEVRLRFLAARAMQRTVLARYAPGATRDVAVSTFEWRPGEMVNPL